MRNHTSDTIKSEIIAPPLKDEQGIGPLTLPGFLRKASSDFADHEALCWTDPQGQRHSWTYRQFAAESRRVARSLLALGLGKNARVGILISNRPEWLFAAFGITMAGGVAVALNTFSTSHELRHQLDHADVQLLLMESGVASKNFIEDLRSLCPELDSATPGELLSPGLPYLRRIACIDPPQSPPAGLESWATFLAHGDTFPEPILDRVMDTVSPVDQGLIFFSSGSTALPKAILQTHRAATLQCWRFGKVFEVDGHSRALPANGFFFSGNFAQAVAFLGRGGCLVLQRFFEPDKALQLLQTERVTSVLAWLHQEARLQECAGWNDADLSSLRYVSFHSIFRQHPTVSTDWKGYQAHGMTETFTITSVTHGDDFKPGSFGPILPGNTVRIIDPDSGKTLPLGDTGEILIKGPTTMLGYLKVPAEATFDAEGFIHTGDAGYLGEDGHLYWKGRLNDIIKTGGANVSPSEIDDVIAGHPGVQSCCTVGVDDAQLGERVVSCIVPLDGQSLSTEDIRQFARQFLAAYKVPKTILFMTEEELPMTGSAKVRRADVKAMVTRRLAADAQAVPNDHP